MVDHMYGSLYVIKLCMEYSIYNGFQVCITTLTPSIPPHWPGLSYTEGLRSTNSSLVFEEIQDNSDLASFLTLATMGLLSIVPWVEAGSGAECNHPSILYPLTHRHKQHIFTLTVLTMTGRRIIPLWYYDITDKMLFYYTKRRQNKHENSHYLFYKQLPDCAGKANQAV